MGVSYEFLNGGTVCTERFVLLTQTVAEPRVTRSRLKFFPPAHLTMTVNELETFDFPGNAEAEPDEDNNNLADLNGTIAYFQSVELNRAKNTGTDRFGSYQRVAKSQEVEGVERDIVFQPVPNWQTMISGAYMNALENAPNPTDPAFDRFTPAPAVPRWQGRMFSKLSFTEGPLRNFEVGVGLEAVDDSRTVPKSVRAGGDPAVDNENLKQFYAWRVQLNFDNLLDRRYFPGGNTWASHAGAKWRCGYGSDHRKRQHPRQTALKFNQG